MKFTVDESGKVKKTFEAVIEEYFEKLKILKFVYVWRDGEKYSDGQLIVAEIFKLSNKDRDLWSYDVRVEVDQMHWAKLDKEERRRLAYHELQHVELEYDVDKESGEDTDDIKMDSEERVCFHMRDHDLVIRRFRKELKKYGLSGEEEEMLDFLTRIDKKFHSKGD